MANRVDPLRRLKLLLISLAFSITLCAWSEPNALPSVTTNNSPEKSDRNSLSKVLGKVKGASYVGSSKCAECHVTEAGFFSGSRHERSYFYGAQSNGCESCHGPGSKHVESVDAADIVNKADLSRINAAGQSSLCLSCHQSNFRAIKSWQMSDHARGGLSCWDCHQSMLHFAPKAELRDAKSQITDPLIKNKNEFCFSCHEHQRLDFSMQFHHPIDRGRMLCTDCHNPHGEGETRNAIARSKTEACLKCHSEKRGPYVWPHQAMDEGCTVCHQPHGSVNDKLLTQFDNGLCLQCHYETQFPNFGDVSQHRFRLDRHARCLDCHLKVHGSNVQQDLTQ